MVDWSMSVVGNWSSVGVLSNWSVCVVCDWSGMSVVRNWSSVGVVSDWSNCMDLSDCGDFVDQRFTVDDSVEAVVWVSGVVYGPLVTIWVDERVGSMDDISVTGFVLAL